MMLLVTASSLTSCTRSQDPLIVPETNTGTVEAPITVAPTTTSSEVTPVGSSRTSTGIMTYTNPAGQDKVSFTLTQNAGVIESLVVTSLAENEFSKNWQAKFIEAASSEIVGKNLKDLKLNAVGGASLTTGAFNQFIASL